jgi:hypothetical protein
MAHPLITDLTARPVRWQVCGTIDASMADTTAMLLAVAPGRVGHHNALVLAELPAARRGALSVVRTHSPDTFQVIGSDEDIQVAVDRAASSIGVQFWFGGVHTVEPDGTGCRIRHRVYEVRAGQEFLAAGIDVRLRDALLRLLRVIADWLGAPADSVAATTCPPGPEIR